MGRGGECENESARESERRTEGVKRRRRREVGKVKCEHCLS